MPMIPSNMQVFRDFMSRYVKPVRPDFEKLRKERNAAYDAMVTKLMEEYVDKNNPKGITFHSTFNPKACYCNCGLTDIGGNTVVRLCEHLWNGPVLELENGQLITASCSLCGMTAYSHDMRFAP